MEQKSKAEEVKPANGHKRKELSDALKKDSEERANGCLAKITVVLQEFNCELIAQAVTTYDEDGIAHTKALPFVRPKQ